MELLTTSEMAKILNISTTVLLDKAKAGIVPYYLLGGLFRFDKDAVLKACQIQAEVSLTDQDEPSDITLSVDEAVHVISQGEIEIVEEDLIDFNNGDEDDSNYTKDDEYEVYTGEPGDD